jgi:predicted dehydrogenase
MTNPREAPTTASSEKAISSAEVRWGILGISSMARGYWDAISKSANASLVAVASRDAERCRQFIEESQQSAPVLFAPGAYGAYEALLADSLVDAVYIPLPTGIRKEWVIRAAEAGKHVICEKPCAPSTDDLREMVSACQKNNVQFMDGVMFLHDRRQSFLEAVLHDKAEFGPISRITASVGYNAAESVGPRDIRYQPALEPFGTLGDDGWYAIRVALWAMEEELPVTVTGRILASRPAVKGEQVIITAFSGELFFKGGATAAYYCSILGAPQQWAQICGTKAYIDLPDFLAPMPGADGEVSFAVRKGFSNPSVTIHRVPPTADQSPQMLVNLVTTFSAQVLTGEQQGEWPRRSLRTQLVMDACYQSALQGSQPVEVDAGALQSFLT